MRIAPLNRNRQITLWTGSLMFAVGGWQYLDPKGVSAQVWPRLTAEGHVHLFWPTLYFTSAVLAAVAALFGARHRALGAVAGFVGASTLWARGIAIGDATEWDNLAAVAVHLGCGIIIAASWGYTGEGYYKGEATR
jgi:hypothetical protein